MAITDDARDHLFQTLRQQYDEDDARTLITMLSSHDPDTLATRAQLDATRAQLDAAIDQLRQEMREGFAEVRSELKDAIADQTRTFTTWMFALLSIYTLMAGSFVALGTFIVAS
jgi:Spy/CpxP family protein refolding chaperone